ncbi:peroxide stress protein YaaA [Conchiformibius kuhniae]|uniref:UPF0246 protein LVJ77_01865 n=1 Tax=Conchiformibius kuhniae TaxID=211502 RepID=A0A8T9MT68_9NEIS|nr:peroxide stress protein YaaA [Conchiformibius kuhniae]UOP05070.1 peroxide stress protein YaaA [Conchiformibius kuhniae]
MLFLLSPAKNLNETRDMVPSAPTQPPLLDEVRLLVEALRGLAPHEIAALMRVSDKIALLNAQRFAQWHTPFTPDNAKAALYLFNGDVYEGIDAYALDAAQTAYVGSRVRILSGLYGIVRPFDLIQPYRLEMGTPFANVRGANLYRFWGGRITDWLNGELARHGDKTVVNLASAEYFKAVQPDRLDARLITPVFKERKGGDYKVVSFYAKRARGLMVRYAAQVGADDAAQLKHFDWEGYAFNEAASSEGEWVFLRDAPPVRA